MQEKNIFWNGNGKPISFKEKSTFHLKYNIFFNQEGCVTQQWNERSILNIYVQCNFRLKKMIMNESDESYARLHCLFQAL